MKFIYFPETGYGQTQARNQPLFARQNLVAWCIVPFDIKNRDSEERAQMLKRLGITKLAYDWREKNIPGFDDELNALNKYHIDLQAFWLMSGTDAGRDKNVEAVFSFLSRRHVKTQIWLMLSPDDAFDHLSQIQKVDSASKSVKYIVEAAARLGCTVGLYNHNGWFGEPDNQLAIIEKLHLPNLGMVYNFNHAQDQITRFAEFYPSILPYLLAINLAGLRKGDQRIYPINKGDSELEMIRIISGSAYRGPIGIINEDTDPDAEKGLEMNLEGLKEILKEIGDEPALKTYR
ncbi:MAG: xylose isomerase [Bacteroidota bacterium]|nr:xylose isomerase [Bacteroidota bacterium]MDP4211992.1 xylose isomerase [Bacteroidota bacterium]MDP4249928.1 xylose isomerase [Bacteroidota bacterium]